MNNILLFIIISSISIFILIFFRKQIKILIQKNNDRKIEEYMNLAINFCVKNKKKLDTAHLNVIINEVYIDNYCTFNTIALAILTTCFGVISTIISNKNMFGLIAIIFPMCIVILIVLNVELDYIIRKKILLKLEKELK